MREESWYVFGFKTDTPEELVAKKISGKWEDRNHMSWEERDENPSEVEKKAHTWGKENLDKYVLFEYSYHASYYAVSYSKDTPGNEIWVQSDDIRDRLMEELASASDEFMFMYDWNGAKRIEIPIWDFRAQATDREEAMKYLARAISMGFPGTNERLGPEMMEFAKKWEIPLELGLLAQAGTYFNNYDCASWNTSSKYC